MKTGYIEIRTPMFGEAPNHDTVEARCKGHDQIIAVLKFNGHREHTGNAITRCEDFLTALGCDGIETTDFR